MNLSKSVPPFLDVLTSIGRQRLGLDDLSQNGEDIVRSARREGVSGFLYRDISDEAEERLITAKAILRSDVAHLLVRDRFAHLYFLNLLDSCSNRDVQILLLKGVALNHFLYGRTGLRPMSDIDFLIRARDRDKVCEAMDEIGMTPNKESDRIGSESHQHNVAWHLLRTKNPLVFECHWNIVPPHSPFPINAVELWNNAVPCQFHDSSVFVLSTEHFLLHLCIHAHFHGYKNTLRDYYDIYVLAVHNGEIDWSIVASTARQWNADSIVYAVLLSMTRLFIINAGLHENILSVRPRQFIKQRMILPLLQRRIDCELTQNPDMRSSKSSPSDIENIIMAVVGRINVLRHWIFPSRERVCTYLGMSINDWSMVCYATYYWNILVRLCSSTAIFAEITRVSRKNR